MGLFGCYIYSYLRLVYVNFNLWFFFRGNVRFFFNLFYWELFRKVIIIYSNRVYLLKVYLDLKKEKLFNLNYIVNKGYKWYLV